MLHFYNLFMSLPLPAPRLHLLVPCAGAGVRAGTAIPKQYVDLGGEPLVVHTLRRLCEVPGIATLLVVLSDDDHRFETLLPDTLRQRISVSRRGGNSRADTVLGGLEELVARGAQPQDWVLVHDAARCLIQASAVRRLIDACLEHPVGGLLAWPVADTLKQAQPGTQPSQVQSTVPRSDKWLAQTPQMARLGTLHQALQAADAATTDESSAMEAMGLHPLLVLGHWDNLKVTYPGDFELALRLMTPLHAFT